MFIYPAYKALKQQLNSIAPVFYFLGQYNKGKDNTSYIVPALYIEMPKNARVKYWGKGKRTLSPAEIKLHYITNAPYKNHDNSVQDAAISVHSAGLKAIDDIMSNLVLRKEDGSLLTQRFINEVSDEMNYQDKKLFSILTYSTEIYL